MEHFKQTIAAGLAPFLPGMEAEEIREMLETPSDEAKGDVSLPCFKLSKKLRKAPAAISDELKASVEGMEAKPVIVDRVASVSGYLNFYLKPEEIFRQVMTAILEKGDCFGSQTLGKGKTVVIDYSSPNIAKPFHVGHLRSTVIGNALYRIFSFLGYRAVGVNHLGDWGTQFGKLITAYLRWGEDAKLAEGAIDELLKLYVRFHEEAEKDPDLNDEARAWFVKMEHGDPEALKLWGEFVDVSMAEFNKIYELLSVRFDYVTGESFFNDRIEPAVRVLREKGLLEEDQGAWLVRLDDYGMAPALMLKQDGSSLYHTRDVAAAIYRKETFRFDKAVYVTDYSQSLHFRQWFKVVELMGYDWANDLVHVPFGRVSLEGASLSTRKGNVVKLEDLLNQAIQKIENIIDEKNPELENKREVAKQVGVGAVIFNDLSGNRIKDIDFSWDDALSFEGETGPYVQYTHARACSLLAKGADEFKYEVNRERDEWELFIPEASGEEAEFKLVKQLSRFGDIVAQAAVKLEPSLIARYLVDTAQAFNRFYHHCPILKAEADDLRVFRLALTRCAQITLQNGLGLIGLSAPERI